MVKHNLIMNCPISEEDINNSILVYGQDIHILKGKTMRDKPIPVKTDYIKIPREILERNNRITLAVDILYVNNQPFLVTISRNLHFATVENLNNRRKETLIMAMKNVTNLYEMKELKVETILVDPEFKIFQEDKLSKKHNINVTSAG